MLLFIQDHASDQPLISGCLHNKITIPSKIGGICILFLDLTCNNSNLSYQEELPWFHLHQKSIHHECTLSVSWIHQIPQEQLAKFDHVANPSNEIRLAFFGNHPFWQSLLSNSHDKVKSIHCTTCQ